MSLEAFLESCKANGVRVDVLREPSELAEAVRRAASEVTARLTVVDDALADAAGRGELSLPAGSRPLREVDLAILRPHNNGVLLVRSAGAAIAEMGAAVLWGDARTQRASAMAEHLMVLIRAESVLDVVRASSVIRRVMRESGGPVHLVMGPSATRDVEHVRVLGAHGPVTLRFAVSP
ncbi:MAG: LUD domain-containing protein [Candidatus Caldarchaeales archaeon]